MKFVEKFSKKYFELIKTKEELAHQIKEEYEKMARGPIPDKLRPATPKDIVEGNFIWYPSWRDLTNVHPDEIEEYKEAECFRIVRVVLNPTCDWKAFSAHNGCRYGLRGAFVEV